MTDELLRELATKQDATITALAKSGESLIKSQTETNKRLGEISGVLINHAVITNRLDTLDKELNASFKRVHSEVASFGGVQKNVRGCSNSVSLLDKDIVNLTKSTAGLVTILKEQGAKLERVSNYQYTYPSTTTIRWGVGILVAYSITFGTFVTQSISGLARTDERVITLLERDIKDTAALTDKLMGYTSTGAGK